MVRPTEFEDLKTTSVSVGRKQLADAKKAGLNISDLLRGAIADALRSPVRRARAGKDKKLLEKKLRGVPRSRVRRALGMLANGVGIGGSNKAKDMPTIARTQAELINNEWNTNIEGSDLLAMVPRY